MTMKKRRFFKPRLPAEAVNVLRHKGGAHSTKKGAKGYNRDKEKANFLKYFQPKDQTIE